jgi:hypothetical protein
MKAQAKTPLKHAAAVNATRWARYGALKATGLPVESASGGRTKFNRCRLGVPKAHALDATCVRKVEVLVGWQIPERIFKATGRGFYRRTRSDKYGFPRGYCMRTKRVGGFKTGDVVRAVEPRGKNAGTHIGRVAVRARGSFNIGSLQDISAKYCTLISRGNGYGYNQEDAASSVGFRRQSPPR